MKVLASSAAGACTVTSGAEAQTRLFLGAICAFDIQHYFEAITINVRMVLGVSLTIKFSPRCRKTTKGANLRTLLRGEEIMKAMAALLLALAFFASGAEAQTRFGIGDVCKFDIEQYCQEITQIPHQGSKGVPGQAREAVVPALPGPLQGSEIARCPLFFLVETRFHQRGQSLQGLLGLGTLGFDEDHAAGARPQHQAGP